MNVNSDLRSLNGEEAKPSFISSPLLTSCHNQVMEKRGSTKLSKPVKQDSNELSKEDKEIDNDAQDSSAGSIFDKNSKSEKKSLTPPALTLLRCNSADIDSNVDLFIDPNFSAVDNSPNTSSKRAENPDIWSFGMICAYAILSHSHQEDVVEGNFCSDSKTYVTEYVLPLLGKEEKELVEYCLISKEGNIEFIKQMKYFESVSWNSILSESFPFIKPFRLSIFKKKMLNSFKEKTFRSHTKTLDLNLLNSELCGSYYPGNNNGPFGLRHTLSTAQPKTALLKSSKHKYSSFNPNDNF